MGDSENGPRTDSTHEERMRPVDISNTITARGAERPGIVLPERLSIELSNACSKGCAFCYNGSTRSGLTSWSNDELVDFVSDCTRHGVRAVSFGGGEPLEYGGVFELLERLKDIVFRSLTTNGLALTGEIEDRLVAAAPDKVHVSIHFPHHDREVRRVRDQVLRLADRGIRSGVNLLVENERIASARDAVRVLGSSGIGLDRIVLLPLRSVRDPAKLTTPQDLLTVTDGARFQSMSCLRACGRSPRFSAVSWDKKAAWCSYTAERQPLETLDARGLHKALDGLGLVYCGTEPREEFV